MLNLLTLPLIYGVEIGWTSGWKNVHPAHPFPTAQNKIEREHRKCASSLKVAFIQKVPIHLSFSQTDKPYYFPGLEL